MKPWEMESKDVDIIESYDAEVIGERGKEYSIEFIDPDGKFVEALLPKIEFDWLPHEIGIGTNFWIVIYYTKDKNRMKMSTWPVAKYWHESWKKGKVERIKYKS